jgi:hypothetical protein
MTKRGAVLIRRVQLNTAGNAGKAGASGRRNAREHLLNEIFYWTSISS